MTQVVAIPLNDVAVTPVFKHMEIENLSKSETAGRAIMEVREVVQVQFAGRRDYSPVFPVDAFAERDGHRVVTYAEKWSDQYRAFREGAPAEASGTPIDVLKRFGLSDNQISFARALRVYSVEALHHLEGPGLKALGMHQNALKEAAQMHMAELGDKSAAMAEVAALKLEIERLKAQGANKLPDTDLTDGEVAALRYDGMLPEQLKARIKELTGETPRGNPSVETLRGLLAELEDSEG